MAVPIATVQGSAATGSRASAGRAGWIAADWPMYAVLAASISIVVGLIWDISWHRTIGRDTFWSPPHLLQQGGAIVSGLSCGYLALATTFAGDPQARARSVRFWRFFQAPIGAWVAIWGTIMMITSAPFDDWWHNAYGLDVKIISPPHMVLASGMIAIQVGAMLLALGAQNRAQGESDKRRYGLVFLVSAASIVLMAATVIAEDASYANEMHGSKFYRITAVLLPLFLVAFARASRLSWPASRIAIVYMAVSLVAMWILEMIPATPMLAPIYNPVTRMVPPAFPLLLFAPAIAIDLSLKRFGDTRDWTLSLLLGVVFVAAMAVVHWKWADFMLSPSARNPLFGADQWDYSSRLGPWRYQFWSIDAGADGQRSFGRFATGMAIAVATAVVSSRVGLAWGKGMARVRR